MSRHYSNYVWKGGLPYGVAPLSDEDTARQLSYKIASDPYHKRVSIEKYDNGRFAGIVYDSALFDLRQLKLGEQLAWQKTTISEGPDSAVCHIRNQDDRLVLIEEYRFAGDRCRECRAFSPLGTLISVQKICYQDMEDPFNGVVLYDSNGHQVMSKQYAWDADAMQFSELLKEEWTAPSV